MPGSFAVGSDGLDYSQVLLQGIADMVDGIYKWIGDPDRIRADNVSFTLDLGRMRAADRNAACRGGAQSLPDALAVRSYTAFSNDENAVPSVFRHHAPESIVVLVMASPGEGELFTQRHAYLLALHAVIVACFGILFRESDGMSVLVAICGSHGKLGKIPRDAVRIWQGDDGTIPLPGGKGIVKDRRYSGSASGNMLAARLLRKYSTHADAILDILGRGAEHGCPPVPEDMLHALSFGRLSDNFMDTVPFAASLSHLTPLMRAMEPCMSESGEIVLDPDRDGREALARMQAVFEVAGDLASCFGEKFMQTDTYLQLRQEKAVSRGGWHRIQGVAGGSPGLRAGGRGAADLVDAPMIANPHPRWKTLRDVTLVLDDHEKELAWEEASRAGLAGSYEFFWAWWGHFGLADAVAGYFARFPDEKALQLGLPCSSEAGQEPAQPVDDVSLRA